MVIGSADVAEEGGIRGGAADGEVADGIAAAVVVSAEAVVFVGADTAGPRGVGRPDTRAGERYRSSFLCNEV